MTDLGFKTPNTPAAQAAKAIDMAGGDGWIPRSPSRPASSATVSGNLFEIGIPVVLDAGPAPPDYSQATAREQSALARSADDESLYDVEDNIGIAVQDRRTRMTYFWKGLVKRHWKSFWLLNLSIYCILLTIFVIVRPPRRQVVQVVQPKLDAFYPDYPTKSHGSVKDSPPKH